METEVAPPFVAPDVESGIMICVQGSRGPREVTSYTGIVDVSSMSPPYAPHVVQMDPMTRMKYVSAAMHVFIQIVVW